MQRGGARHTTRKYQVRPRPRQVITQVIRGFAGVPLGDFSSGILTRHVTLDRHLFRQADAWTLGAVGVDQCRRAGVTQLRYVVAEHGIYSIAFEDFVALAERKKFPNNDETQLLLARSRWLFFDSKPTPTSQQTSLFAEVSASR